MIWGGNGKGGVPEHAPWYVYWLGVEGSGVGWTGLGDGSLRFRGPIPAAERLQVVLGEFLRPAAVPLGRHGDGLPLLLLQRGRMGAVSLTRVSCWRAVA